ncbi:MAG: aldehyde ferredoxin oxidoreductase family protein [Candidatus Hodarchaeota archaeon]
MTNGFNNRLIRINLTTKNIETEPLPNIINTFIGGKGLGAYILTSELVPKINPLEPYNKLIITTGPLQGSIAPICGRYCIVTKSPLTGLFIDSHVGGSLGPELKFAGYDAIIIEGTSPEPCYISIINDNIQVRNGETLKGLSTQDKEFWIKETLDEPEAKIMSIGVAGENKVRYACITSESFRNAGRGGIGAVFGSKNLLALAIKGTKKEISVADPETLEKLAAELNKRAAAGRKADLKIYKYGTPNLVAVASNRDQIPVHNFQRGTIDDPSMLGEEATSQYETNKKPCYKCPISCAHIYRKKFFFADQNHIVAVPEYETLGMVGSNCGVNIDTVIEANYLANQYGLDTISLGNTIAFFLECSEKKLVPSEYANEKVFFGDNRGILDLINKIANRQGIGSILAEGTKKTTEKFGQNTERFAINVKGLEMAAWDPRGKLSMGLSYATASVGASHLRGWPATARVPKDETIKTPVVETLVEGQDLKILKDSLIICHFTHSIKPALDLDDTQKLYTAITGSTTNVRDIAQNIWSLTRYFNMREFGTRSAGEYDQLPFRLLHEPLPSGVAAGSKAFQSEEDFKNGLNILYKLRQCQSNGDLTTAEKQRIENLIM